MWGYKEGVVEKVVHAPLLNDDDCGLVSISLGNEGRELLSVLASDFNRHCGIRRRSESRLQFVSVAQRGEKRVFGEKPFPNLHFHLRLSSPSITSEGLDMRGQVFLVSCLQVLSVLQLWLVPCLLSSLFFNGVRNFFIISASVLVIPILFNLIVVSHYWLKPLLVIGLLLNGFGGAGAVATVVIAWADPAYTSKSYASPNMSEGNVMMLLVSAMLSLSAVLELFLVFLVASPDKAYSCCWGNFSESNVGPVRAEHRFLHWIRLMRVCGVLVFLVNLFQIWAFIFWSYSSYRSASVDVSASNTLVLRLRILSLFYFVMVCLWSAVACVLAFNVNSSRKLRFAAVNSTFVILLSAFFIVVFFSAGVKTFGVKGLGPAPWIFIFNLPFQITWMMGALTLAYSKYPFRDNSCCWPDCTPNSTLQEEFDIWQEEEEVHNEHPNANADSLEETDGL